MAANGNSVAAPRIHTTSATAAATLTPAPRSSAAAEDIPVPISHTAPATTSANQAVTNEHRGDQHRRR